MKLLAALLFVPAIAGAQQITCSPPDWAGRQTCFSSSGQSANVTRDWMGNVTVNVLPSAQQQRPIYQPPARRQPEVDPRQKRLDFTPCNFGGTDPRSAPATEMPKGNQRGSIHPHNGKLRLAFYVDGKLVRKPTGLEDSKEGRKAAGVILRRTIASIELGTYEQEVRVSGAPTFGEFCDDWIGSLKGSTNRDGGTFKPASVVRYERLLRRWRTVGALEDVRMTSITSTAVAAASAKVSIGVAPNTRTSLVMICKKMLRAAAADGLVLPAVPEGMKTPAYERERLRPEDVWSPADAALLEVKAAEIDEQFGRMVSLDIRLGMRGGELRALRLEDIDMTRREVKVRRTAAEDYSGQTVGAPKTKRSVRDLPFAEEVAEILRAQIKLVLGKSEWLFPSHLDPSLPLSYWKWRQHNRALGRAMGRTLPPHRLRHTFASTALTHGATIHEVAEYMGDTQATVEAHYAAWNEEEARRRAASKFGSMYDSFPIRSQEDAIK